MAAYDGGVLLVDWENLAGALIGRGKVADRRVVDDLWEYAYRQFGGQLQAHMAAAKFDPSIVKAMREHMIERNDVQSTKEQADIQLTVLAMDYLHQGCRRFILVTGDQDFLPLILRMHRDGSELMVVYGDPSRLGVELQRTLDDPQPGLGSGDIGAITELRQPRRDTGSRSLLGLLELQRLGIILGGPDRAGRISKLARWGVLENEDENTYWAFVDGMCEKIVRTDAAKKTATGWGPQNATRTYIDLGMDRYAEVRAIDYAIRVLAARPRGLPLAGLRSGPFSADDGSLLTRTIDALASVELVRRGADSAYAVTEPDLVAGYLEPLWRVYAAVSAESYRRQVRTLPYGQVESLLGRGGIGQGPDRRAAGRIAATVRYASAAGVIDAVAVNERRHAMATNSAFCRPFEHAYHEFYRAFADRLGAPIPEQEILGFMEERDRDKSEPVFGFDKRDRHRVIRILVQSHLAAQRDGFVTLTRSRWGEAGASLRR